MKNLLIKILNKGNAVQTIDLSQKSYKIPATPNAKYLIIDTATGKSPDTIKAKRDGNDLVISGDDESQRLIIENYYTTDHLAIVGENNGQLYTYNIDPNHQLIDVANFSNQQTSIQSLGTEPVHQPWWTGDNSKFATLGLVGLGVAGIAIASSHNSDNKHDNDNNNQTPTNHTPTTISLDNNKVDENQAGAIIGKLTTTDQDTGDTFTYSVNDNRFEVVNGQLKLKDGMSLEPVFTRLNFLTIAQYEQF